MRNLLLSSVLLMPVVAGAAPLMAASYGADAADSSLLTEKFTVDSTVDAPGATLKSGSYVIRVVDHLADRCILRVESDHGKTLSTFLAVPNGKLATGSQGPVVWNGGSGHVKALRGFNFPGGYSVEFVYPKAQAVKIAQAHAASVEAIDPSSDNLPSKQKNLTDEDMRMVTLWTLTPTRVNGTDAMAAEKYKPTEPNNVPQPVVARNEPPAGLPAPRQARVAPIAPVRTNTVASAPKPVTRRPVATALPHTASELPAVLMAGVISLLGIATLRVRRMFVEG